MSVGELFLESLSSGVITPAEIDWLLACQQRCTRAELATLQRLGRLLDEGAIQLGCRLSPQRLHHRDVLENWIEPLGRRRHAMA